MTATEWARIRSTISSRAAALALSALTAGCLPVPGEDALSVEGCAVLAGTEALRQGALVQTDLATDLALRGSGFFAVHAARVPSSPVYYTRDGRMTTDRDGFLVDLQGRQVLGWPADASGELATSPGPLLIGFATSAPRATAQVMLKANLQADALIGPAFDPSNPGTTSNFSTSMTIHDALGSPRGVQVFFTKTAEGRWTWDAMTDGGALAGGTPGTLTPIGEGTLTFDPQGRLAAETQAWSFHPLGSAEPQPIVLHAGDPTSALGTGLLGVTQFASPSASIFVGQDGHGYGQLASLRIQPDGMVEGYFTNGRTRTLAQIGVALFPAPAFLAAVPGHLYAPTLASGAAQLGAPCTGVNACVVSGAHETLTAEPTACVTPPP